MKRVPSRELLDEDLGSPEEIRDTLLDLRDINRRLGGFASMAAMLRAVARRTRCKSLAFLDVAGGVGDVADCVRYELLADRINVNATVIDRALSHMNGHSRLNRVSGDALALPFAKRSFDVVGCNLFLHHLEPVEVIIFLNEALRVARFAVIASDLRRNFFHWASAYAGRITYRSRLTRNDAPASVRQAYTMDEIGEIAKRTGAESYDVNQYYFQRFGLILWKVRP